MQAVHPEPSPLCHCLFDPSDASPPNLSLGPRASPELTVMKRPTGKLHRMVSCRVDGKRHFCEESVSENVQKGKKCWDSLIILRTWWSFCCRNLPALSTPGLRRKPSRASRMFTISPKSNPTPKVPQPERLDEVYAALKNGLQWVLSHQAPCIKWRLISSLIYNVLPTYIVHACVFLLIQGLPAGLSVGLGQLQQTDERIEEELQTGTFWFCRCLRD